MGSSLINELFKARCVGRRSRVFIGATGLIIGILSSSLVFWIVYNLEQHDQWWMFRSDREDKIYLGPDDGANMMGFVAMFFVWIFVVLPFSSLFANRFLERFQVKVPSILVGLPLFLFSAVVSIGLLLVLGAL